MNGRHIESDDNLADYMGGHRSQKRYHHICPAPGTAEVLIMDEKTYSYNQGGDTPFGYVLHTPVSPSPRSPAEEVKGLLRTGIS